MSTGYRIYDEPRPGGLGHLVVNPMFPLLAIMLAGAWLAWPWFVFNAVALGSPTRRKESAIAAIAVAGTVVLGLGLLAMVSRGVIESKLWIRLAVIVLVTWKLGLGYVLHTLQNRTFHVYEYYGGAVRNGMLLLAAGWFLRPMVLGLSDSVLWKLIAAGGVLR
jgi:hypothetical protein